MDAGPKMTLEDVAERCKVDVNWLRNFVGRKGVKPSIEYRNPTRRYYSLIQVRKALMAERKGELN